MKFAPSKYELIHFTRSRQFNLKASVRLGGTEKLPSPDVRVLGVWLDTKLSWSAHFRAVQKKASMQTGALTCITALTWGASFSRARQVYSSVARPALAYGAGVWHTPGTNTARGLAAKLQPTHYGWLQEPIKLHQSRHLKQRHILHQLICISTEG